MVLQLFVHTFVNNFRFEMTINFNQRTNFQTCICYIENKSSLRTFIVLRTQIFGTTQNWQSFEGHMFKKFNLQMHKVLCQEFISKLFSSLTSVYQATYASQRYIEKFFATFYFSEVFCRLFLCIRRCIFIHYQENINISEFCVG